MSRNLMCGIADSDLTLETALEFVKAIPCIDKTFKAASSYPKNTKKSIMYLIAHHGYWIVDKKTFAKMEMQQVREQANAETTLLI